MQRSGLPKMMIIFFSICLASIALRAMIVRDAAIPRLLVGEAVFALLIVVLFIFTKPRKPSNPQLPLPSHEPPHLMRRIKSGRIADGL